MNSSNAMQERATYLRHAAMQRWLVKDEVVFLLLQYKHVGVPMLYSQQMRPPSGTLLFYNTLTIPNYKKDGWHWQKRKDKGERVREDRAKLVINRKIVILGTYVHSAESSTFHRRIYSLRDSKENIVLVHYFDEVNKMLVARHLSSSWNLCSTSIAFGQSQPVAQPRHSIMPPLRQVNSPKPLLPEGKAECSTENCITINYEPQTPLYQTCSQHMDGVDRLLFKDAEIKGLTTRLGADGLFHDQSKLSSFDSLGGQQTFEQVEIADFSPDWDFESGGAKILICLAANIPEISREPAAVYVQFGNIRVHADKISDTVLRCSAPSSTKLGSVDMFVCFWHESQKCMQLSHKQQFTYRKPYQVSPLLTGGIANNSEGDQIDTVGHTASCSAHGGKRGRSPTSLSQSVTMKRSEEECTEQNQNLSTFVESDLDERQCKIRVVERLNEFHQAICTKNEHFANYLPLTSVATGIEKKENEPAKSKDSSIFPSTMLTSDSSTWQAPHNACFQQRGNVSPSIVSGASLTSSSDTLTALDDSIIEALSDNDLEQLSEQLLERVVCQLVIVAHTSEELLEELNSLDETGLSLLHYVSFYNYSQLVPVLIAHGAHINQQSTQGQTALHLAAGCGHSDVVDVLLQSKADLQSRDFGGFTAADRAEKSGHADVAAKLYYHMGFEASSTHWGPVDEILRSNGSPMIIDDAPTPFFDAGDMGLLAEFDNESAAQPSYSYLDDCCESPCDTTASSKVTSYVSGRFVGYDEIVMSQSIVFDVTWQMGENHEHNRKLLLGAFSSMSLHDKCALSLTITQNLDSRFARHRDISVSNDKVMSPCRARTGTSVGFGSSPASMVGMDASLLSGQLLLSSHENDSDVQSVIAGDEESLCKLQAAMELMGADERQSLEDEVKILQHGIRAWLLRRNCKNMRETTEQLREATQSIEDQQKQQEATELDAFIASELSERERAAVTVQSATRTMLARRSFLQTKHVAIKFQAATRGVLCRKNFARMKALALASLVIQRNVREWWNKQPAAIRPTTMENNNNDEA